MSSDEPAFVPSTSESPLERVLASYVESLERGVPIDRQQLLDEHPELVVELESFFRNRDAMENLAARLPLGETAAETVARGEVESVLDGAFRYFGDYELGEEIGRGGMGVVYRARQLSLNRPVALKMILAGPHASPRDTQRLRNEAESVAQLDHPRIVPLYEIGSHAGRTYLSMKLIEGRNLTQALPEYAVSPDRTARLMVKVARAVHHAHERGIMHRDLKPANILLDVEGEPHLTDFGLAKQLALDEALTHSGTILGTPQYMAPEQARAEKGLTTAADVYSLGAMLYELLSGKPPFHADSWTDLLRQVLEQEPVPPHQAVRHVPRDLSWICMKCLEKTPDRRYRSALELAEDLERWLRKEPIHARSSGPLQRASKWVRRHPTLTLLLVTVLLGVGGIVWQWREAIEANRRYRTELDQRRWGLAEREWQGDDVIRARQLLLETPPERRGWEWNYLWNLMYNTPFNRLPELETHVTGLAMSGDGRQLAIAQASGQLHVWDLPAGETRYASTLAVPCEKLAFSPEGRRLLTLHDTGWQLRDLETGRLSNEQTAEGNAVDVDWHPNGRWFYIVSRVASPERGYHDFVEGHEASTGERLFRLQLTRDTRRQVDLDTPDGAEPPPWPPDRNRHLHVATDGSKVFHLGSRRYYHPQTGELMGELDLPDGDNERYPTKSAVLLALADNERVAVLAPNYVIGNSLIILQPVGQRHRVAVTIPRNSWYNFTISPDGRRLAVAIWDRNFDWDDLAANEVVPFLGPLIHSQAKGQPWVSTVYLYDAGNGRLLRTLRGFPSVATHLIFHPDGQQLFVGGGHAEVNTQMWLETPRAWGDVAVWNIAEEETSRVLQDHTGAVRATTIDATGQLLATAAWDGSVRLWDLTTGQPRPNSPIFVHPSGDEWVGAHFAPDRDLLAVCGGSTIQLITPRTGAIQRTIKPTGEYNLHAIQLSRDEAIVAYLGSSGARVHDLDRDDVVLRIPERTDRFEDTDIPNSIALSADGRWLAVTYQFDLDGELRIYDVPRRKLAWRQRTEAKTALFRTGWGLVHAGFSPDGQRVAAVGNNGEALVYDVRRGKLLQRFDGHGHSLWAVAFSPDGKRLVAGSHDRTVKIWNLSTEEAIFALRGHRDAVQAICFSPNGGRLVSGARDGRVRVWEAEAEVTPSDEPTFQSPP